MCLGRFALLFLCAICVSRAADLTIYTENYPPFNYEDAADGALTGLSADLVREIQKRLCDETPILIRNWSEGYRAAQEQPGTVLFSTTRLPQREALFKWVGPLAPNRWALFAKATADIQIDDLEAARAYRIGIYKDDAVGLHLKTLGFGEALKEVPDDRLNAFKLMRGKIDLWAGGELQVPVKARQAGIDPNRLKVATYLHETQLYIAFHKDTDDAIITKWQTTLDAIIADGTRDKIYHRYGLKPTTDKAANAEGK
jgi:polar amino acid transport system substrate-binding protein